MQLIYYGILFISLLINIMIIWNDLRYKKIPNIFLLPLLFLGIIFYILYGDFSLFTLGNIVITFLIGFGLYFYGFWSAGDAKYIIILSLFVSSWNFTVIFGNIGILTLIYLFLYFLYFYGRCLFDWNFLKTVYTNVIKDLKDKSISLYKKSNGNIETKYIFLKTSKIFGEFILFFSFIRLTRIYLFEIMTHSENLSKYVKDFIIHNPTLSTLISIIISISLYVFSRKVLNFLKKGIKEILVNTYYKKKYLDIIYVDIYSICFLSVVFSIFIIYEYVKNPEDIITKLYLIFTLYIGLHIAIRIFLYIYKITFHISEFKYIHIQKLESGEIVDKQYLYKIFSGEEKDMMLLDKKISFEVLSVIENIENPIEGEDVLNLQKLYKNVNEYKINRNTKGFKEIIYIKTLKTFAFSGYIFGGVIITYFFGDSLFTNITIRGIDFFEKYFHVL